MSEDNIEGAEYGQIEGLVPKIVEGKDPGSVYTVVVRTAKGYVAVRRLASETFRVRAQRFDNTVWVNKIPLELQKMLVSAGIMPAGSGERVSGIAVGSLAVARAIALSAMAMLNHDFNFEEVAIQEDPNAVAHQEHAKNCVNCAKKYMLTPSETAASEMLTADHSGAHDPKIN